MNSRYWQHNEPLKCPFGHIMTWLGAVYWICCKRTCGKNGCNKIYVAHYDKLNTPAGGGK